MDTYFLYNLQSDPNSLSRERAASRNVIVDSYMAILPNVQRKLMFEHVHVPKKSTTWRREGIWSNYNVKIVLDEEE